MLQSSTAHKSLFRKVKVLFFEPNTSPQFLSSNPYILLAEMGQQSLIYNFVARGTTILAEYTDFTGNFTGIAPQCLQKLSATNNKFTYNCDGHTFNYQVDDGFTYCVVTVESAGRQIPIAFLERTKEDFTKKYSS